MNALVPYAWIGVLGGTVLFMAGSMTGAMPPKVHALLRAVGWPLAAGGGVVLVLAGFMAASDRQSWAAAWDGASMLGALIYALSMFVEGRGPAPRLAAMAGVMVGLGCQTASEYFERPGSLWFWSLLAASALAFAYFVFSLIPPRAAQPDQGSGTPA